MSAMTGTPPARSPYYLPQWLALGAVLLAVNATYSPPDPSTFDFAAAGRLPVLANGRLKPLDTVARTSLLLIHSKQTLRHEGRTITPMAWLFDVLARPEVADQQPLFLIDNPDIIGVLHQRQTGRLYISWRDLDPHLDKIENEAQAAMKVDANQHSPFQRDIVQLYQSLALYHQLQNTLRPTGADAFLATVDTYAAELPASLAAVEAQRTGQAADGAALQRLMAMVQQCERLDKLAQFRPVAPAAGAAADAWQTVGGALLGAVGGTGVDPAAHAWVALADAYRHGDANAFWGLAVQLTTDVAAAHPGAVTRARTEYVTNRVQPFYLALALYALAFLAGAIAWLRWEPVLRPAALIVLAVAVLVHTAGLVARTYVQGYAPVTNLYSSAIFVGWAAALLGLLLECWFRRGLGGMVAALIGFATAIIAHHLSLAGDTMEMMRAVLDSNFWLSTHVTTITIGYSGTFLAGFLALVYVLRGVCSRGLTAPAAADLTRMVYGIVCFSTLFSFVGTVLGGIWADQSWGRFWGWDPKENGALLLVLWNTLILHARWGGYIRERGLMLLAIGGNIVTACSWFGVNLLGVGLHSYGFMASGAFWLAAFSASQFAVIALGLLPLARWRSAVALAPAGVSSAG